MSYLGRYKIRSAMTKPTGKKRFEAGMKGKIRNKRAAQTAAPR